MREEINPETDDLRTHHIRFDVVIDGSPQSFIPCLTLLRHDGTIVVRDIKHDFLRLDFASWKRRSNLLQDICTDVGWRYEEWGADDIAATRRIRLSTVEIQTERFVAYEHVHLLGVMSSLRAGGGEATLGELKELIGGGAEAEARLKAMMCHGYLTLPLEGRFTDRTSVQAFQRCRTPLLDHVE